jgi:hypothetical protein
MRYDQFKINLLEAILDEAEMTPRAFQDFLNSPLVTGMKMGFELESVIHNVRDYPEESEDDLSYDERCYDIESIVDFFGGGDGFNGERELKTLRNDLYDDFHSWQDAEFDDYLQTDDAQTFIKEFIRDYLDDLDYHDKQMNLAFAGETENPKLQSDFEEGEMRALEKLRDEWENDDRDGSWNKYCDVMDMNYMSDVKNKFEHYLYWPYTSYSDEEYLNVDWVADALYDETKIKATGFDSYHSGSRSRAQEKGEWIIEPDSSIEVDESNDGGLEFVSPALEVNEALKQMQQVLEFIREHGYTNSSTGLHINISVPDYNVDKLDYVKLAIFLGDKHVLEQFDRLSNHYCDGAYKKIGNKVQQMKGDELKAVMNKMKEGLTLAASKIIHTGYTSKYTSINTKEGYIEFRSPGGDYLNKTKEELVNTALRMALALRIATDENMYKQEYQKRLYKVLTDSGEKDDLTKFKDYISRFQTADKETRSYIIQTIQAEREARKAKKKEPGGGSRPYWMVRRRGDAGSGGMAVFADTAWDAVKDVAKSWGLDPIYLVATPMADEKPDDNYYRDLNDRIEDEDALGDYQLVNSNRSIDRRLTYVTRATAEQTARNIEQHNGFETGSVHVMRITRDNQATTGAAGHNWRIYDIQNPDVFSVVAAGSRTDAVDRWNIVNPERPAELVDAVQDEGAMKYEFTIAQQAFNPDSQGDNDRFINPQELYKQRTGRSEIPVRKVWATSKEQAIGKVRSFFSSEFFDVPPEWLKINVVGI